MAQKTTLTNVKETPKYVINLIAQLAKDLEVCEPTGEIFVKSGKDYWIACKKSDLREVFVIVCQKNANLILIDGMKSYFFIRLIIYNLKIYSYVYYNLTEEVKQLCSTHFSNIFFME